jgi:hypothetical protein
MKVSGQLHAWPLYPQGKSPWYPLDRRLGWPQSRSGRGGEEKKFTAPAENGTLVPGQGGEEKNSQHLPDYTMKTY